MTTVTNYRCIDERGERVLCDAFGNNVAFKCSDCGHPMLAIIRRYQRGSSREKPAECPHCHFRGWMDTRKGVLILKRVDGDLSDLDGDRKTIAG
jgi:DNA-directed RNA polymerase subunit RPC12/RpoP